MRQETATTHEFNFPSCPDGRSTCRESVLCLTWPSRLSSGLFFKESAMNADLFPEQRKAICRSLWIGKHEAEEARRREHARQASAWKRCAEQIAALPVCGPFKETI